MSDSKPSDLTIREPTVAEVDRVLYLFRGVRLRPQARLLVAVRSRPIERFVAAAAWWSAGSVGFFQLSHQIKGLRIEVCAPLIKHVAEYARIAKVETIQYMELLEDNCELIEILEQNGFEHLRSERFFEVTSQQSWKRTVESYEKYKGKIPSTWRTESIRQHAPETILDLIDPYRLMPPSELRDYWRADSAFGFELDMSSILFNGSHPIGAFLARRIHDLLCVDIRVVRSENRVLNSLGNVCLLYHAAMRNGPNGPIRRLQFRGGATEHRETANLALRMGGCELSPRHVYRKII